MFQNLLEVTKNIPLILYTQVNIEKKKFKNTFKLSHLHLSQIKLFFRGK